MSNEKVLKCGRCRVATYCSRDCQKAAWKMHKKECIAKGETIVETKDEEGVFITIDLLKITNWVYEDVLHGVSRKLWDGNLPEGIELNEVIEIKIQIQDFEEPFILYDKQRKVVANVWPENCPQYRQLFDIISGFAPCSGKKAYFKAKITSRGVLFVSTQQVFVRIW